MLNFIANPRNRLLIFIVSFVSVVMSISLLAQPVFLMTKVGALALYFVIWWLVLFIALPLGVDENVNDEHNLDVLNGVDRGAPSAPKMLRKAILTTWMSLVVFALAAYGLIIAGF